METVESRKLCVQRDLELSTLVSFFVISLLAIRFHCFCISNQLHGKSCSCHCQSWFSKCLWKTTSDLLAFLVTFRLYFDIETMQLSVPQPQALVMKPSHILFAQNSGKHCKKQANINLICIRADSVFSIKSDPISWSDLMANLALSRRLEWRLPEVLSSLDDCWLW